MSSKLLGAVFRRSSGAFVRAARQRGLRTRAARTLEAAAHEISPADPGLILDSRELFEQAATRAVVGDGGNLELSFGLVDELANTVEALGLARSSDVPDPFRRVWVSSGGGQRVRGVVLTRRAGELAVFCPPSQRSVTEIGGVVWLRYRGFSSSVEYDLQLDDAVRLPGAHVLHLKRRSGQGAIGRSRVRYATNLKGSVRLLDGVDERDSARPVPCVVTDISSGGLALDCMHLLEKGARVRVDFPLRDAAEATFSAEAFVRWSRESAGGFHGAGLAFSDLPRPRAERLERYLRTLSEGPDAETVPESPANDQYTATPPTLQAEDEPRVHPPAQDRPDSDLPSFEPELTETDESPGPVVRGAEEEPCSEDRPGDLRLIQSLFRGLARVTALVTDRPLVFSAVRVERRRERVAGAGGTHVAFKFAVDHGGAELEGCFLLPLADALALASAYLMRSIEDVAENRSLDAPDQPMKLALLQMSVLVAQTIDQDLRRAFGDVTRARCTGCQGVRADVPPALRHPPGTQLLIGHSEASLAEFDPFELILMLPVLELSWPATRVHR